MKYKGDELNDAFCQIHPWLAQKVTTRSAHAAVSKVSADAKALNIRRTKAGGFLKDVRAINAIKLSENDILAGVRHHSAASAQNPISMIPLTITQNSMGLYQ